MAENSSLDRLWQEFETAPAENKTRPLWFWNTEIKDMNEEEVREMVRESYLQSGYNGFGILPNWLEDYLSEDYFNLYEAALDEGSKYGMQFSLYDENGFPSFSAGGLFGDTYPDLTAQRLDKIEKTGSDGETVGLTLPDGKFMGAVAMNTDTLERIDISDKAVIREPAGFDPDLEPIGIKASSTYSVNPGYEAGNVVDGDRNTRWNAESMSGGNSWLQINFGKPTTFDCIKVYEPEDDDLHRTRSYQIQYFDTAASKWVTLYKGGSIASDGVSAEFEPVSASLVRLYIKKVSTDSATISELEVWNGDSKMDIPPAPEANPDTETYVASSEYELDDGFGAEMAFDKDEDTRWNAGAYAGADQWLQVNFGEEKTVDSVHITEALGRISAFRIDCYSDGRWNTVYRGKTIGENEQTFSFDAAKADSVRLYIESVSGSPSVKEMAVFSGETEVTPSVESVWPPEAGSYLEYTVPTGKWKVMAFCCVQDVKDGMDYLNPDSVAAFIELTYEAYYSRFKKYFDNGTITTAFYDEPTFWPWGSDYGVEGARMWTPSYNEKYGQVYDGESPVLYYPALWYDIGEDTVQARNQLMDVRTQMFSENYIGQINSWCKDHGIRLTGHMLLEEWVNPVGLHGDLMRVFQYQDIPGVDVIGYYGYTQESYKIVSSSAYNWDKGLVMSESFGAMGANMDPKVLYKSSMDQYAKGVNMIIPHAVWYDDSPGEVDYPPELSYRNSLYTEVLPQYNEYMSRLNTLLQNGRHVADIAMLYPIDYLESEFIFNGTANNPDDANYMQVGETLSLSLRRDFTYIHPNVLDSRCSVSGDTLSLNNTSNYENYKVFIMPATRVISLSNLQKIKEFYDNGGKVIATEVLPDTAVRADDSSEVVRIITEMFGKASSEMSSDMKNTNSNGGAAYFIASDFRTKLESVLDDALEQYDVEISGAGAVSGGNLSYIHKVLDGRDIYYFANSSDNSVGLNITLRGEYNDLWLWDPHDGTRKKIDTTVTEADGEKVTSLKLDLAAVRSAFIVDQSEKKPEEPEYKLGDVDKNGTINVSDIMTLKNLIMTGRWSDEQLRLGDMDKSNTLNVSDMLSIKSLIMAGG